MQLHFWSKVFWLIVSTGGKGLFDVVIAGRWPPLLDLQAHPWPKVLAVHLMSVIVKEGGRKFIFWIWGEKYSGTSKECQLSRVVQDMHIQRCRFLSQCGSGLIKESDDLLSFSPKLYFGHFMLILFNKNTNENVYLGNVRPYTFKEICYKHLCRA